MAKEEVRRIIFEDICLRTQELVEEQPASLYIYLGRCFVQSNSISDEHMGYPEGSALVEATKAGVE